MASFKHSGDLGDVLLSLPVVRFFGGGILYLEDAPYTLNRMTRERIAIIAPLLKAQPYIEDVLEWNGQRVDTDLNDFRPALFSALKKNYAVFRSVGIWEWFSSVFNVPPDEWKKKWLEVPGADFVFDVVINRVPRWTGRAFPWDKVRIKYPEAVFVGLKEEHATLGEWCRYIQTRDLLEAAKIINASKLFIGNQSCCHAIAQGLQKAFVLEVSDRFPNCVYPPRPNAWYGFDENVYLPNLEELP